MNMDRGHYIPTRNNLTHAAKTVQSMIDYHMEETSGQQHGGNYVFLNVGDQIVDRERPGWEHTQTRAVEQGYPNFENGCVEGDRRNLQNNLRIVNVEVVGAEPKTNHAPVRLHDGFGHPRGA